MKGKLGFVDQEICCIIGDLEEERKHPQMIYISLSVSVLIDSLRTSDQLQETVDYVELLKLSQKIAQEGKFQMIEALALAIYDQVMEIPRVEACQIKIKKPNALPNTAYAYIELST